MTYSMHPAKIEINFRLVTLKIHEGNATRKRNSQVIIKVNISTQNTKKQNKPIDLLPIINNKLLYKK